MTTIDKIKFAFAGVFWTAVFVILGLFGCNGCSSDTEKSEIEKMLEGKHELRRFTKEVRDGFKAHAGYFLFAGSAHAESTQDIEVTFSFQLNDGDYAMAKIPFNKIRVHVDSSVVRPCVKFSFNKRSFADENDDMDYVMREAVYHMTIWCKEEDFPYHVNINQL